MGTTKKKQKADARNLAIDTLLKIEKKGIASHLAMREVLQTIRTRPAEEAEKSAAGNAA